MILRVASIDLGMLIEQGYFLNLLQTVGKSKITEIQVSLRSDKEAKILRHSPKTGHGYRLMKSYEIFKSKIRIHYREELPLETEISQALAA